MDNLVQRISSGSRNPEVLVNEPVDVGGETARRVVLRFDLSGEEQQVTALVMTQGVYEHRLQFQSVATTADRYAPLVERLRANTSFEELPELSLAAAGRAAPALAGARRGAGGGALPEREATDALDAFLHARSPAPSDADALVGQLRVHTDYAVPGGAEIARRAIAEARTDPRSSSRPQRRSRPRGTGRGRDRPRRRLGRLPGDRQLRVARLNWGCRWSCRRSQTPAGGSGCATGSRGTPRPPPAPAGPGSAARRCCRSTRRCRRTGQRSRSGCARTAHGWRRRRRSGWPGSG